MVVPDTEFILSIADLAGEAVAVVADDVIDARIDAANIPLQVDTQVTSKVNALDVVLASDRQRVARAGRPKEFRVLDRSGRKALGVRLNGSTDVGQMEIRPNAFKSWSVKDRTAGKKALEVRSDGSAWAEGQRIITLGGAGAQTITKAHVLIAGGQSLGSGRAHVYGPALDWLDQRICQFGATSRTLTTATVPLDMHDTSTGLAPVTVAARIIARELPPGEIIVIIPAAHGGTGLITDTVGGCWDPAYTGTNAHLYSDMLSQIDAALPAIAAAYPSATVDYLGMMWNQGEADCSGTTDAQAAQYQSTLISLVNGLRTHIGQPNLPVVIGEMGPEWAAFGSAQKIRAQHVAIQTQLENITLVRTPRNTANYDTDMVHQSREGVEGQGANARAGLIRALTNVAGTNPEPPARVWATRSAAGAGLVEWSQPYCRVTSFIVEYSTNGTTWTVVPRTNTAPLLLAADYQQAFTGLTASTLLWRVSTVNAVGTSATSNPVPTLGA